MNRRFAYPAAAILTALLVAALLFAPATADPAPPGAGAPAEPAPVELAPAELAPVGTAFTYQGTLTDGGNPAQGQYDFQFKLFDAAVGGVQLGTTLTPNDIPVARGVFTVRLDFGAGTGQFGGGARWLEIAVRPGASGGAYTTLAPRQELSPAPSALSLPGVYVNESQTFVGVGRSNRISGNEVFGVRYVGGANQYGGMYIETSDAAGWPFYGYATNGSFRAWHYYNGTNGDWYLYNAGIRLAVPNEGGLRIGPSADYSLVISSTTGSDGIRIYDTGDDGIQVGSAPDYSNYGVYIPSPGVTTYGLWPNTANALGEWALYTVDNIEAGNVTAGAFSLIARVTGPSALTPGDVVAAAGVGDPLPGGQYDLPLVRLAEAGEFAGVIGVVERRMVWAPAPGKEAEGAMSLQSADGPAEPGDYVRLQVLGVAQVKVDPDAVISPGQRLTASGLPGRVRPLRTKVLDGMPVVEGAPVIGIALEAPVAGQERIAVLVTLR